LFRKAHNGAMKTFVPQGAQWYENILPLAAQIPPKIPMPDPLGSNVSSFLGRKAHNFTMKTFVPQGAQWYENILPLAAQIPPKSPCLTPWGHMFLAF
jgi:hypothetical protein